MFENSHFTTQITAYVNYTPQSLNAVRKIIATCCENYMRDINALCGQNVDIYNVKAGD